MVRCVVNNGTVAGIEFTLCVCVCALFQLVGCIYWDRTHCIVRQLFSTTCIQASSYLIPEGIARTFLSLFCVVHFLCWYINIRQNCNLQVDFIQDLKQSCYKWCLCSCRLLRQWVVSIGQGWCWSVVGCS